MTKKDYQRAVKALNAAFAERGVSDAERYEAIMDQLALMFGEDNSRFDYGRFRAACLSTAPDHIILED